MSTLKPLSTVVLKGVLLATVALVMSDQAIPLGCAQTQRLASALSELPNPADWPYLEAAYRHRVNAAEASYYPVPGNLSIGNIWPH